MIGFCGVLLAMATAAVGDEARVQALPAAASAADEAGNAYREQTRGAIRDVLARREFADLHADPYAVWRMILGWLQGLIQRLGSVLRGMPGWLFWSFSFG